MKYRTISRLIYLKRAQHRGGHGIHSPFLFRLITTVIEDRRRYPEYKKFKELNIRALRLLDNLQDSSFTSVYYQSNLQNSKPRKFFRIVEFPLRYSKVVFRLIRFFKPSSIINHGSTLGVNPAVIAMADNLIPVYLVIKDSEYEVFSKELLKDSAISNIYYLPENSEPPFLPELSIVNYPFNPELARIIIRKCLDSHGDNSVLIIRGIHESKNMEDIWHEVIDFEDVRVSLDLFEIGIVLFRKGLQKENFIHRF
jgi:hypothetical protein